MLRNRQSRATPFVRWIIPFSRILITMLQILLSFVIVLAGRWTAYKTLKIAQLLSGSLSARAQTSTAKRGSW
jgi:hypothetical protein